MSQSTEGKYIVLITGANRGLGKGLVDWYLKKPNTTVIALNRDIERDNSNLILVKTEATESIDPAKTVKELEAKYGINHVDLVVANAGISQAWPKVSELNTHDLQKHLEVNVYSAVWLWQAFLPLLHKAKAPKFVTMSSSAGSLSEMGSRPMPNSAYGTTKAALNYLSLKMHFEEEHICVFPIDPGWVQTDLGNHGAVALGFEQAEITTEESVSGMVKVIDEASRERSSGKFWNYTGEQKPW